MDRLRARRHLRRPPRVGRRPRRLERQGSCCLGSEGKAARPSVWAVTSRRRLGVPFASVDAVLEGNGTVERRKRILPPRAGAHFVPALGLFPHLGRRAAGPRSPWTATGRYPHAVRERLGAGLSLHGERPRVLG
ncbi:transposase domain-containing protein [Streptomyces anulatus]